MRCYIKLLGKFSVLSFLRRALPTLKNGHSVFGVPSLLCGVLLRIVLYRSPLLASVFNSALRDLLNGKTKTKSLLRCMR